MFLSMTGYGGYETKTANGRISVEVRSLNSRSLDININAPECLFKYENEIKKFISENISRGRIIVYIKFIPNGALPSESVINVNLAKVYYNAVLQLKNEFGIKGEFSINDLINIISISKFEEPEISADKDSLFEALNKAFNELNRMRTEEGAKLERDIKNMTEELISLVDRVEALTFSMEEKVREKLMEKIRKSRLDGAVEEQRLAQEILFYVEKCDIKEEIVRLKSHLSVIFEMIESKQTEGRKLNFIIQELVREFNTINSKSVDAEIIRIGVNAKKIVEQIREQAQNIE
ncbi:MAG: YicC/YloC family endoribonuclease [Candidatus Hydrogenedentota bacterium]